MARTAPYQPLVLRILHGIIALFVIGALLTGFWVYNTYDGRWGQLTLPQIQDIQGIHGTLGLSFLIVLPAFALYSFHVGQKRLIQADVCKQVTRQIGKPIWWITMQRFTNTAMLLAGTFSVISGRMMLEEWLPSGELNHIWYYLHLSGWVVMVCCLALHLLMSAKVGGIPLLLSMLSIRYRPDDSPALWINTIRNWLRRHIISR
jgi:Prokaryotic cytochrome b561